MKKTLPRPKPPLGKKILRVCVEALVYLVLLEAGLRIGGFVFLKNQEAFNKSAAGRKGDYRIMCIGESSTALGGKDSYPRQLEGILNQRCPKIRFSVINKGMVGVSSEYILSQLDSNINRYKPDMVIAMMSGGPGPVFAGKNKPEAKKSFLENLRVVKLVRLIQYIFIEEPKLKRESAPVSKKPTRGVRLLEVKIAPQPVSSIFVKPSITGKGPGRELIEEAKDNIFRGEYLLAQEAFKKALALNEMRYEGLCGLGYCYLDQKRYPEAQEQFKAAINVDPDREEAYFGLRGAYREQKLFKEAQEYFNSLISNRQATDMTYISLGLLYNDLGKKDLAKQQLEKARDLKGKNCDIAYHCLAWMAADDGDMMRSAVLFSEAKRLRPRGPEEESRLKEGVGRYDFRQQEFRDYISRRLAGFAYSEQERKDYLSIKNILEERKIKLVCAQYPMVSVAPLKDIFSSESGIVFVDNEKIFRDALTNGKYEDYFVDYAGGIVGHCSPKGNQILAQNIAEAILAYACRE